MELLNNRLVKGSRRHAGKLIVAITLLFTTYVLSLPTTLPLTHIKVAGSFTHLSAHQIEAIAKPTVQALSLIHI